MTDDADDINHRIEKLLVIASAFEHFPNDNQEDSCILRSPAAAVAVCERPACGINGRIFIRKFSSGG